MSPEQANPLPLQPEQVTVQPEKKQKKSGIPTGNAGEYFVMGELLRRGFDAQLADRNTKGYDILVGNKNDQTFQRVQIKTVRSAPWYVKASDFEGITLHQLTIYVLLGKEAAIKPVRYFIVVNHEIASYLHRPANWRSNGFMPIHAVLDFEDKWDVLNQPNPNV